MPRWVARVLWSMRGKRRVTIQLDSRIAGVEGTTLEGVLLGRWSGHYVIELAKLVRSPDESVALSARFVEIPRERVIFLEIHA